MHITVRCLASACGIKQPQAAGRVFRAQQPKEADGWPGRNGECVARNVRIDRESGAQETLFEWMDWHKAAYPELALAFHIPNGGKRNAAEAAHLKRQGVKAGVPDICLPVARDGYHGLFIELKVGKNKATALQEKWLHDYRPAEWLKWHNCNYIEVTGHSRGCPAARCDKYERGAPAGHTPHSRSLTKIRWS